MFLNIDGHRIEARPDQSLLELVEALGLQGQTLSQRPLAAKMAGEVFTLNYIPLRSSDTEGDTPTIRRAVAASRGVVRLLRYTDASGRDTYLRTAQFAIFLALKQLWPQAVGKISCSLGSSVYIAVSDAPDFSASRLKAQVAKLVQQDIPLVRRRVPLEEARARYHRDGQEDKARLLSWRQLPYFDEYAHGEFADYYYGEMMPSTGYLTVWDVQQAR